jgi:hypothetical protein
MCWPSDEGRYKKQLLAREEKKDAEGEREIMMNRRVKVE